MSWGWRKPILYTHRWLGIATGWLFVLWFASGIVMMYARMPELPVAEAVERLPRLDLTRATVSLASIASADSIRAERVHLEMLRDRPVYRLTSGLVRRSVFADTGEALPRISGDDALAIAGLFAPEHASTVRYDLRLDDADQWTFARRAAAPFHRIALGDPADTRVYVTEATGEIVMRATAGERLFAYPGAVLHWLYFAPLRRNAALWTQIIIWVSAAGSIVCVAGLVCGVMRAWRTPYTGLMKWHHYSGLIFGATTLTFVFSGLLSMGPWDWSPGTAPSATERERVSGGPLDLAAASPAAVRDALRALNAAAPRPCTQLELFSVQREIYARCRDRMVPLNDPTAVIQQLAPATIEALARVAMPDAPVVASDWLTEYDAYYYSRDGSRPLPVLRVQYGDRPATWLYFDGRTGTIARKEERRTRVERWLYHGLHSFDFPLLYYRRPLWDIVVITLSVGGLVLSATTLMPGWRRLRRRITSRSWP